MCLGQSRGAESNARKVRGQSPCFWCLHSSEVKLIRVPKEAYLKSHPRNTLSSPASTERFAAEQTQRPHATRVQCSDRGYFVRRTKPLLPRSHRHKISTGAAAHSAPNQEATASNDAAAVAL